MSDFVKEFMDSCSIQTFISVDYNDIDNLITSFFGQEVKNGYECVPYQEWSNDSKQSFDIDGNEFDQVTINKAYEGRWEHYAIRDYLQYMCYKKAIPAGEYLITISW